MASWSVKARRTTSGRSSSGSTIGGSAATDLEREYLTTYHPIDERVPRFRHLPARRLVHITDLYTAEELKTSRTYNEILRRAGMQDGLNVQLPGLAGSHIGWGLNDPVDAAGWGSSRITMVERLLPHIQQFVPRPASAGGRRRSGRVARRPARHHRAGHHPGGRARAESRRRTTGPWPCCAPARAWSTRAGSWARPSRRTTPCCRAC